MPRTAPPGPYVKVVLRGFIGPQPWSIGVYCDAAGAQNSTPTDCVAAATSFATAAATWGTAAKAFWSSSTSLNSVAVYAYAGGSLASHANGAFAIATPPTGAVGNPLPAFTSFVVTTLTGSSGASYRGRAYVPGTGAALTIPAFQITLANSQTMATAFAAMLASWQVLVPSPLITNSIPVVASFTKGVTTAITAVKVDTMPDTQHRREDKLVLVGAGTHSVP